MEPLKKIQVIDSHTGGEPTRVVVAGGPDLGRGSMVQRRQIFKEKCDTFRAAVVNEPRGSEVLVGCSCANRRMLRAWPGDLFQQR